MNLTSSAYRCAEYGQVRPYPPDIASQLSTIVSNLSNGIGRRRPWTPQVNFCRKQAIKIGQDQAPPSQLGGNSIGK